jgi:hypothetical protein
VSAVVLLVEGESDRRAVEVLARRRGSDLAGLGVEVVAMGGITNLRTHLSGIANGTRVAGLYDVAQRRYVEATLGRLGSPARFYACHEDLEDELIRALGRERVLGVIDEAGDLASYTILRRQPFHRDRPEPEVLRRFVGTTSGRKVRYAGLLTAALALDHVPEPLTAVLAEASR